MEPPGLGRFGPTSRLSGAGRCRSNLQRTQDLRALLNEGLADPAASEFMAVRRVSANLSWAIRRRASLRRLRCHASAVEEKARSQLLTLEIHLLVKSPYPVWPQFHLTQLLSAFEIYASGPNRLRARRPRRGRRIDRCLAAHRSWPGAKFLVSHEEAYALTGLPLLALATFSERQVWTRRSGASGEAPHATGRHSGKGPEA